MAALPIASGIPSPRLALTSPQLASGWAMRRLTRPWSMPGWIWTSNAKRLPKCSPKCWRRHVPATCRRLRSMWSIGSNGCERLCGVRAVGVGAAHHVCCSTPHNGVHNISPKPAPRPWPAVAGYVRGYRRRGRCAVVPAGAGYAGTARCSPGGRPALLARRPYGCRSYGAGEAEADKEMSLEARSSCFSYCQDPE